MFVLRMRGEGLQVSKTLSLVERLYEGAAKYDQSVVASTPSESS